MTRRLLTIVLVALAPALLLGACSSEDGDSDQAGAGSEAQPASGTGDEGDDFCAVVEDQVGAATGEDLLAALPAIEAMADAAPDDLQGAFEDNLAALEPLADAGGAEEARSIFVEEVTADPAYGESLSDIGDGIAERCDVDIDDPAS